MLVLVGMSDEQLDGIEMPDVPLGDLAKCLENNASVRARVMETEGGQLTRWPNKNAVGLKSVKAMGLNSTALEVMAEWWVQWMDVPKPPGVDLMRREAWLCKTSCFESVGVLN